MIRKPNLEGDAVDFAGLSEALGSGVIHELTTRDTRPVAPFTAKNPNIVFMAGSGLPPGSYPDLYGPHETPFAIEVVRVEDKPKPSEPDLNNNRYVFGRDTTGQRFLGYDVTEHDPNPTNGQVLDHWSDWPDVDQKFPTKWKP